MADEEDVLSKALADLNSVSSREFRLKQEQEVAVRALLHGKDVLAVLPTGFGKSLIYQVSFRKMNSKRAKRGDAFREAYGELGVLRSLCKEG